MTQQTWTPHQNSTNKIPSLAVVSVKELCEQNFSVIFKDFQMYFICFAFIYCFRSLNVCKRMYGISWWYYAMNETSVYNAALMEVRVQLWLSHRQLQVTCNITHVYDHLATGSCCINSYFVSYIYYTGHYLMNIICHFPPLQQCTCGQVTQQVQFIWQEANDTGHMTQCPCGSLAP